MFMATFGNCQCIFHLYGAPTDFVTRGFEVNGHAGLHGNVSCVGKKRIVDFFRGPNQERKLSRFETDGVTEEKIRVIGKPVRAHALDHGFEEILRPCSSFQSPARLQPPRLNGIVALAMPSRWLCADATRFTHIRMVAIDGTTHVNTEDVSLL